MLVSLFMLYLYSFRSHFSVVGGILFTRSADVGKGDEKIRRDRGWQHHKREASRTGGADGNKVWPLSEINATQARNFSPV